MTALNMDSPVPCRFCGGAFEWHPTDSGDPGTEHWLDGLCGTCGAEWLEVPSGTPPTFRWYAEDDRAVAALVAEIERLQAERDHLRAAWAAAQAHVDCCPLAAPPSTAGQP